MTIARPAGASAEEASTRQNALVTGAGFIGVRSPASGRRGRQRLNVDARTYAGNLKSLTNYRFAKIDVCDPRVLADAFAAFAPDHAIHLAAESQS